MKLRLPNTSRRRRIHVANFDNFFAFSAGKCEALGPRCLLFAKPGDIVLLYELPSPGYLMYIEHVLGYPVRVFAPKKVIAGQLINSVIADKELMKLLKAEVKGAELDPLILCPEAIQLAERLQVSLRYKMDPALIRRGDISEFNDKLIFNRVCRDLGLPVNTVMHCESFEDIIRSAQMFFSKSSCDLIIKGTRSAGGLRNLVVPYKVFRENRNLWEQSCPAATWGGSFLVERVVEAGFHFSVLAEVTNQCRVQVNGLAMRHVDNFESLGATFPARGIPKRIRLFAKKAAELFGTRYLLANGYRGPFDIDMSYHEDQGRGHVLLWETNARHFATEVQNSIADALALKVTRSNEAVEVPKNADLKFVCRAAKLVEQGEKRVRVVITLPPSPGKGKVGVCVGGMSHKVVDRAYAAFLAQVREGVSAPTLS